MNNKYIIEQAKELYLSGLNAYAIADRLGVSATNVYYWIEKGFKIKRYPRLRNGQDGKLTVIMDYLNTDDNLTNKDYIQWADDLNISPYTLHTAAYLLEIIDGKVVQRNGTLRGEALKTKPYYSKNTKLPNGILNTIKELILKNTPKDKILRQTGCALSSYYFVKSQIKRVGVDVARNELDAITNIGYIKSSQNPNSVQNIRKRQLVELLNTDPTLTNQELAVKLNVSIPTISNYLRTLSNDHVFADRDTAHKIRTELKKANKAHVAELMKQDPSLTYKEISKLTGLSPTSIRNYAIELEEERIFGA